MQKSRDFKIERKKIAEDITILKNTPLTRKCKISKGEIFVHLSRLVGGRGGVVCKQCFFRENEDFSADVCLYKDACMAHKRPDGFSVVFLDKYRHEKRRTE